LLLISFIIGTGVLIVSSPHMHSIQLRKLQSGETYLWVGTII